MSGPGSAILKDYEEWKARRDARAQEQAALLCQARHGFWLEPSPAADTGWLLLVPHGTADDGSPLTLARAATALEAHWWQRGHYDDLARKLLAEGVPGVRPAPPRGPLARLWAWLTGRGVA